MSEISNYLWPYDELEFTNTEKGLFMKAPWIQLEFPESLTDESFEKLLQLKQDGPKNIEDIRFMDTVVRLASKYPVYLCLPNHEKSTDTEFQDPDLETYKEITSDWEMNDILEFSRSKEGKCDPSAALSF